VAEFDHRPVLLPEEWQALSVFGLKQDLQDERLSIDSIKLLDDVLCQETLQKIMPELGAPNLKVTTSLVMKRIAFLALAPILYAMSRFNKGLDGTLKNCVFEYPLENRIWVSKMPLKNLAVTVQDKDQAEGRKTWRKDILSQVFAGHLTQLVEQFHRLTKVPKWILWENVAVRVFSIYEQRILPNIPDAQMAQAQADFSYLLDQKSTEVFGMSENPLTVFYREKQQTALSDKPIRVRRTCCYYYLATEPAVYCGSCPLLLKKR